MLSVIALTLHFGGFLCDDPLHAVAFSAALARTAEEETAANEVGREAQKQVCGFYAGDATIASKVRVTKDGNLYLVTQYIFSKDARSAYGAETIFDMSKPTPGEERPL
jgi:hypothetical protein